MVRKKIDNRIRVLIENGVITRHRSFFVVVGDKAKDQVNILFLFFLFLWFSLSSVDSWELVGDTW